MDIFIFKTNIQSKKDLRGIQSVFKEIPGINTWNVDREDIDKILRIESTQGNATEIKSRLIQAGYHCEELP